MPIAANLGVVTKHGDEFSSPVIQENAVLSEDGFGLRVLNCSFLVKDSDSPTTLTGTNIPKMGDEVIAGSKLYVSKISKRYRWDGLLLIDYEAIGIDPAYNGTTDISFEGASTASAEPIESHPRFTSSIGGTKKQPQNGAVFDEKGKFVGFSTGTENTGSTTRPGQSLAGVRSYLSPKDTGRGYFHFSMMNGRSNAFLGLKAKIGQQSIGGKFNGVQLVPYWSGEVAGTWLLTSVAVEGLAHKRDGGPMIVKLSYECQLSGEGGWNNLIYENTQ